jgi:hypothetical protein
MNEKYRATPEQWARQEEYSKGSDMLLCLLELRARVEALEKAQAPYRPTTRLHSYKIGEAEPIEEWGKGHTPVSSDAAMDELRAASAEARPGGLVDSVAKAIHPSICADPNLYLHEARYAIRAVAAWLRTNRLLHAAMLLEREADRG